MMVNKEELHVICRLSTISGTVSEISRLSSYAKQQVCINLLSMRLIIKLVVSLLNLQAKFHAYRYTIRAVTADTSLVVSIAFPAKVILKGLPKILTQQAIARKKKSNKCHTINYFMTLTISIFPKISVLL